ncbi:MAG: hypothetical protein AB7E79_16465 [Rhodospirillaceae bacterium]
MTRDPTPPARMSMARQRAEQAFSKRGEARAATDARDAAFLEDRRTREAANLKRTLELRAQRLAHEAANPKPKPPPKKRSPPKR